MCFPACQNEAARENGGADLGSGALSVMGGQAKLMVLRGIVALVLAGLFIRLPVPAPGGLRQAPAYLIGTLAGYWFLERKLSLFQG